jgi:hypothetical protein
MPREAGGHRPGRFFHRSAVGRLGVLVALASCPLLAGCFGPTTVRQTRLRYNEAISRTNDEELILNLVRLRYNEHPSFLPITGLNAQFELNGGAQYRGGPERGALDNFGQGIVGYADRPTITFAPQRPPELTRALLTQVSLETLYLFIRQGGDLDRALRLLVRTMNGIDNAPSAGGPIPPDAPAFAEFRAVADRLDRLRGRGLAVLTTEDRADDLPDTVTVDGLDARTLVEIKKAGYGIRPEGAAPGYRLTQTKPVRVLQVHPRAAGSPEFLDIEAMLRLAPGQTTYPVEEAPQGQLTTGPEDGPQSRLVVTNRSILEVMYLLSKTVEVPEAHARRGIVRFTRNPDGSPFDWRMVSGDLFHVCVARHRPSSAFVAVKYRDYWYYVDDRDLSSKTTLNLFSELLRLQKIGATEGQPLLSLPLGP